MLKHIKKILPIIALVFAMVSAGSASAVGNFVSYPAPSPTQGVISIVTGPDGNLWFTMPDQLKIGRSSTEGVITEFATQNGGHPAIITNGPDGNLWFTMPDYGKIGKITTSGIITEYDVSSEIGVRQISSIVTGPDDNLWVSASFYNDSLGGKILKVSSSGSVLDNYDLSQNSPGASDLIVGPDGNIWYSLGSQSNSTNYIGKITTSGMSTEYALIGSGDGSVKITLGADGNIWYIRVAGVPEGRVGKIGLDGNNNTEFPLPSGAFAYYGLVGTPNGDVWLTETGLNKLARVSPTGEITEYETGGNYGLIGLTIGPDGNIWLGTTVGIAKLTDTPGVVQPPTTNPPSNNPPPPSSPRTGKLVGATIVTAAIFGMVVMVGYEVKKKHHDMGASNK